MEITHNAIIIIIIIHNSSKWPSVIVIIISRPFEFTKRRRNSIIIIIIWENVSVYFGLLLLLLWFFNVCYVLNIHQLFESVFWFDFLNASVKSFSYSKKECFSHYYHKIVRVFFSNLFESFDIYFFFNFVFMLWVTSAQWKQPMWYLFFQFNTVLSKYQNTQRSFYSKIKFNNIKLNKENIHIKIIFVNWATINIKIWEQFWDSLTTNTFSYLFRFWSVLVMRCWSSCVYFYLQSFFCILKSLKSIFNQNYTKHKETWKIKMIKQIRFEPKTKKVFLSNSRSV